MASHGHLNRMGYTHIENGFLRWQWTSEPEHQIEWVSVAERQSIEQLVSEMRSSGLGSEPRIGDIQISLMSTSEISVMTLTRGITVSDRLGTISR